VAAIAFALASSLTWGVSDFFGGLQSRRRPLLTVMFITQAAGFGSLLVALAIRGQGPPPGAGWIGWAALASVCGVAGLTAFYRGLATGAMGVVAPISSAAAVVPLVVGLALGERPYPIQGAGIALAIVGVVLAAREESGASAAGAGLAIVAALGFGGFFVGIDRASEADVLWALAVSRAFSFTFLACATAVARPGLPRAARDLRDLAAIGVLDTSANLLFALGTTHGLVSIVAVLGSLYPIVTVVLARFVLHERLRLLQRVGAVTALLGAALISSGA
jgi:drug/metabolite transporter (DMT)-like permease